MAKTLGLDLGTNSIGWAVIDTKEKKIKGLGSRIFPEGVNRDTKGGEVSKNETRRSARGARRQQARRKMRKRMLLSEMANHGMCPLTQKDIEKWKGEKEFPNTKELKEWFKESPYELRKKALDESITPMQLGRVLYHMAQRRGFKSNRKQAGGEDGKVKGAITTLQKEIETKGHRTLGEYFANQNPHKQRIRNNYTDRQMYIDEFNEIWKQQAKHHKELTNELKNTLAISDDEKTLGILFYYRPLRSQKYLIGKCSFEPTKPKCPVSAIPFEEFRAYQYAHSIECDGEKLNKEQRQKVVDKLMSVQGDTTFGVIKKLLAIDGGNFNYEDKEKVKNGCYTISKLSKLFGAKWEGFNEQEKEDKWHTIFSCTDADWLQTYAKEKWNFNAKQLKDLSKVHFPQKYASLSRKAINNILPFLKDYAYHEAVVLGGVKNAFGAKWKELDNDKQDEITNAVLDIIGNNTNYIKLIKEYLQEEYAFNKKQLNKLYHHSIAVKKQSVQEKLPMGEKADREISNLRNPIVSQTMFELRKLVNALVDEHGKFDQIKVEMARDLKNSAKRREEIRFENKKNETNRDRVKKELDKLGQPHTHINILKYQLWEECQKQCPFTGKQIGCKELFTGEWQIEHIVPWSKSLNDSFMNKTLCFADENRKKGDRTPYQFYGADEKKWHEVKERAMKLFHTSAEFPKRYNKFKLFASEKEPELDSFISRQLNDTRYISKEAKNILGKVCEKVNVAPGQMTAHLRHHWGLNKIINTESDTKTRNDHRHHAIDALVMACSEVKHLQQLSNANRYGRDYKFEQIERPWEGFWEDAKAATNKVLIAHKNTKKTITARNYKIKKNGVLHSNEGISARGQLHADTVFGKHTGNDGKEYYHVRKPLESLTAAEIPKIVDKKIRELAEQRLQEQGILIDLKNNKPIVKTKEEKEAFKRAFAQPLELPNKNGQPVPVRKVRVRNSIGNAEQLKDGINQYVNPKNNHHVLIYLDEEGNLNEDVVTFWTAVERKKQGDPVFQLPEPKKGKPVPKSIVTSLQINDQFLLGLKEEDINWDAPNYDLLSQYLYRVQKLSESFYTFRYHLASTIDNPKEEFRIQSFKKWEECTPIKVRVLRNGKIEKL